MPHGSFTLTCGPSFLDFLTMGFAVPVTLEHIWSLSCTVCECHVVCFVGPSFAISPAVLTNLIVGIWYELLKFSFSTFSLVNVPFHVFEPYFRKLWSAWYFEPSLDESLIKRARPGNQTEHSLTLEASFDSMNSVRSLTPPAELLWFPTAWISFACFAHKRTQNMMPFSARLLLFDIISYKIHMIAFKKIYLFSL